MTQDFDERYGRIHAEIQENSDLVKALFESARSNVPKVIDDRVRDISLIYFPTGLTHNGLHLGVDLKRGHRDYFNYTIAKMRLLYEESNGTLDLLRVYALLVPTNAELPYGSLGVISEDISQNGNYKVWDWPTRLGKKGGNIFKKVFGHEEIENVIFGILLPDKSISVFGDLDHLPMVTPEYDERFDAYAEQYEQDERFMIREI